MKGLRMLSLLALALALVATPAFAASTGGSTGPLEGVQVSSVVQGTAAGVGPVTIKFTGPAAHTRSGLNVIFTAKQIVAASTALGPLSASLDPNRPSTGTLSSATFPAVHRQNFFLRIKSDTLGTLVSDLPLTLSATIQSSPPTATYRSVTGNVVFYREGDPNKQPVLTVQSVTSDIKPAASQALNISSLVTANVAGTTTNVQFTGSATNLVSGTNVLFVAKNLTATAASTNLLGPTTVTLDSQQNSSGALRSNTFPTDHTQSFFLKIQSQNLGTLVADRPVVLTATIQACPPNATYRSISQPVAFYRQGDPTKQTVLTVQSVVSDVTPSSGQTSRGARK